MEYKLLIVNILLLRLECMHCSNITHVENLYVSLFQNYNRKLFPLIDHNTNVNINFTVGIVSINNFNELSGELELTMLFYIRWTDERLLWKPNDYGGKYSLLVPMEDIWRPQIFVIQSFDRIQEIGNMSILVRIYSSGLVMWNSGNVLKILCSVDVTYFPFDTQICSVSLSGWAYTTDEVHFYITNDTVNKDFLSPNSQWTLQSAIVTNFTANTQEFPPSIDIILTLKRRSDFYTVYIIFPMVFLGSINNLVFVMPANSGERTSVAITTFLSFIVFMQMINDNVPQSSAPLAYIYLYTLFLLVNSSVILFLCIISLRIYDKDNPVPPTVKKAIYFLRFWCFYRKKKTTVLPERQFSTVSAEDEVKNNNDNVKADNCEKYDFPIVVWKIVGKTFDGYCFSALLITFWVMTIQTFVKLHIKQGI